ncbi:MAG: Rossmann-like and DUF2520 domain-containing protein [Acidimicrobiia bacterium]
MYEHVLRGFSLLGPGRAGTSVAAALVARGWSVVAVAGRDADSPQVRAIAGRFDAEARSVADVGRGAELVIVATPDAAIADAAAALAPSLEPDALVVHLSGACTLDDLDKLRVARPDVRIGSLHPLQSLPTAELGAERLAGSWCAVDGDDEVERLAVSIGMRPVRIDPQHRVAYHAAATVASNHLVALLAQAEELAARAGLPREALLPLVRATVDNVAALGADAALTGPVLRGDVETVRRHLDELPVDERHAYRALAGRALQLSGRDDPAMAALLHEESR